MSGFIAIINSDDAPVDREVLEKFRSTLEIRGPDRQRVWINGSVGLVHTLFRTTNEAQYENQPATLDNKVWITGCIRIDARKELVDKLGMTGKIILDITPDSELVIRAYLTWGEKCLEHLMGDFAFVLWDSNQHKMFCARDRFGMRQLYYSQVRKTFIVSNSMQCLQQHPQITRRLNGQAIGDFLLFGDHTWMDKAQTSFSDVHSLLPSHSLVFTDNVITIRRYWDIPTDIPLLRYHKENEYLEHFQDIFQTAVSDRLRCSSAVVSLSGGLDSSSIAATIRKIQKEKNLTIDLKVVTVLYDSIHASDERYFVEVVNRYLDLTPQNIDGGKFLLMSPPVQTTRPVELYQPALWIETERKAATMGRIMLTGEAGDNLLASSSILQALKSTDPITLLFIIHRLKVLYGVFPGFGTGLGNKFKQLIRKSAISSVSYPTWLNPDFETEFQLKKRWSEWFSWSPSPVNFRYSHLYSSLIRPEWSTDDLYMSTDFTLPENRDPFLDIRLLEFVASLPALPWLFKKHLLRKSMTGRLPVEVINRPKTLLGPIHCSLIGQMESSWINDWNSAPELHRFVDRHQVPLVDSSFCKATESYLNLRPFLLNYWLMGLN